MTIGVYRIHRVLNSKFNAILKCRVANALHRIKQRDCTIIRMYEFLIKLRGFNSRRRIMANEIITGAEEAALVAKRTRSKASPLRGNDAL
jgi:hypothetical protein